MTGPESFAMLFKTLHRGPVMDPALLYDQLHGVSRYATNAAEFARFRMNHPYARDIEIWGAALGRVGHIVEENHDLRMEIFKLKHRDRIVTTPWGEIEL